MTLVSRAQASSPGICPKNDRETAVQAPLVSGRLVPGAISRVSSSLAGGSFLLHRLLRFQGLAARLVDAEGLFVEVVSGGGEGAGAAAHADVAEFAAAALPFQVARIAQLLEYLWKTCEFSQMSAKLF